MATNYEEMPVLEDLVGAGMPFSEATAFLDYAKRQQWEPLRTWAYILKRETNSFSKLDSNALAAHIRSKVGDKPLAEIGR